VAALVFSFAAASIYGPIWEAGASHMAAASRAEGGWVVVHHTDLEAEAWIVARGAYALVHHPLRFFDGEHCAPTEKSLAYGPAMLTMAILAIPAYLATGDPVLTFNLDLVLYSLIGAAAMYLLITAWTGVPGAGIVAGLLFGFHRIRMVGIAFAMDWNLAWTVFALFFARRLFARGRWSDAAGLALVVSLQIWESMYTLLAAVLLSAPFALWLIVRYRFRAVRPAQLAFVAMSIAVASVLFFAPYLEVRSGVSSLQRTASQQIFAPWGAYLPSGGFFLGWFTMALVACCLVLGRRRTVGALGGGDPRWALLAGALCTALVAAGPYNNSLLLALTSAPSVHVPNLYLLLVRVIPGLDSIRKIPCLAAGVLLVGCVLAGMGAAALIRLAKEYWALAAAALVLAAALEVIRPSMLGLPPTHEWQLHSIAADKNAIEFFRTLERLGNTGPILELPVDLGLANYTIGMSRISLSFYHHRRIAACMGSLEYAIPGRRALIRIADRLPEPEAVNEIRRLGFTTVLIDPKVAGTALLQRFRERAQHPESSGVRFFYSNGSTAVFTLGRIGQREAPRPAASSQEGPGGTGSERGVATRAASAQITANASGRITYL
jgi:hypothetical protein